MGENINSISIEEFKNNQNKYTLLDVREDYEYAEVHIDPCIHIPMGKLPDEHNKIPKDKPLAIICAAGGRSAKACKYLSQKGYATFNVEGGMNAFNA